MNTIMTKLQNLNPKTDYEMFQKQIWPRVRVAANNCWGAVDSQVCVLRFPRNYTGRSDIGSSMPEYGLLQSIPFRASNESRKH